MLSEREEETGGKAFAGYIIWLDVKYKQKRMVRSCPETNLGFKMKMRGVSCSLQSRVAVASILNLF